MFEPFLSGKVFGLTGAQPNVIVELARRWSGQPALTSAAGDWIEWMSETALQIGGDFWYDPPQPVQFATRNALVSLGQIGSVWAFAFVSPFRVLSKNFVAA